MKFKSVLSLVVSSSLVWSSSAFGFAVGADLSPEQAEVLAHARASNAHLEWRVLTKDVRGKPRTVVIIGEQGVTLPMDTMIAKKVIDQFEHFAVEAEGPYTDRVTEQENPNRQSPMNLPPLGSRVKTIQNAEAKFAGNAAMGGMLMLMGYFLMTGYFSANYFFEGFNVTAANAPKTMYNGVMLGIAATGLLSIMATSDTWMEQKHREKAVAEFVNDWMNDPQYDRPVVLIVKSELVGEVERVLVDNFGFSVESGPPNVPQS